MDCDSFVEAVGEFEQASGGRNPQGFRPELPTILELNRRRNGSPQVDSGGTDFTSRVGEVGHCVHYLTQPWSRADYESWVGSPNSADEIRTTPFVISTSLPVRSILTWTMNGLSQLHAPLRAPRVNLADFTPAVLRFQDGQRASGELQVLSVNGGLLALPRAIDQGSQVKVMFLTHTGPVLCAAEMLSPVTSTQQPFRFVALPVDDRRRLGAAIQSSLNLNIANKEAAEQRWMEKLRAASSHESQPHRRFFKIAAGALALGLLGLGCAFYLLQVHALK